MGVSTGLTRAASILGIALVVTGCSSSTPLTAPPSSSTATVTVGPAPRSAGPTVTVTKTPAPAPTKTVAAARVPAQVELVAASTPRAPSTLAAKVLRTTKAYATATGGKVVGTIAATTRLEKTWLPVVSGLQPVSGRVQVRFLAGRSIQTGWVPLANIDTGYVMRSWVEVKLAAKTLTIHTGKTSKTFKLLAVGSAGSRWPTPVGTFWVERVGDPGAVKTVYGSGPWIETSARGTWPEETLIGVHAWKGAKIPPGAASHGCLRAPDGAVKAVAALPLGTPIVIRR